MPDFLALLAPHHFARWETGGYISFIKTMRHARCGNGSVFHRCGVTEYTIDKDIPECVFPQLNMKTLPKVKLFLFLTQL